MAMEKVRYQPVVMVSFKLFFIAAGSPLAYVKWICKSFSTQAACSKASCSLMEGCGTSKASPLARMWLCPIFT